MFENLVCNTNYITFTIWLTKNIFMKTTEKLNPSDSLEIISTAIHQTQENIKEQAPYFILWGWIILIASLCHYFLMTIINFKYAFLPWTILPLIGLVLHFIYERKQAKAKQIVSYYDTYLKYLWSALGASFIAIIFFTSYLNINPTPFILLTAGIGSLISGLTIKFRPIWVGGIILFMLAIMSLFASSANTLLISSAAMAMGYLIPSYMLKNQD